MPTYVQVVVNISQVAGVFDYHLPEYLEGKVGAGCLVVVPFGGQTVQGLVLGCTSQPQVPETKAIQDLLDPFPVLTPAQVELAKWIAEQTLAPLGACLEVMLPPGLSQHAELVVTPVHADGGREADAGQPNDRRSAGAMEIRLLDLLERRGELRAGQLDLAFPHQEWRPAVTRLARRGLVRTSNSLRPPTIHPKTVRTVQLAVAPEVVNSRLAELGRPGSEPAARREAILRFLIREAVPVESPWVKAGSGGNQADLVRLAELGLVILGEAETWRDPLEKLDIQPYETPELTPTQQKVWLEIYEAMRGLGVPHLEHPAPFLLNGVTGSGKTEIYLRAVAETLRMGRQAIVLVPEIALTPQTIRRFMGRFPGQVGVIHSRLSQGERYDTWRRARSGSLPVIVGPRSALFAPLAKPGLIVVDECHDESYYQSDIQPNYHAVDAALAYARLAGALVLMGSATPDITQTFQVEQGRWRGLSLPERLQAHGQAIERLEKKEQPQHALEKPGMMMVQPLPSVAVVDMREELKSGNRSIFSLALQAELKQVLAAGQQAILFLNRRGTATYVFCRDCGYALHCPRCDRPLTYHDSLRGLVCHTCGYQRQVPVKCPSCGSRQIRQFGTGTEKVESEVLALLPQARTLRWDAESTRQKGAHEVILGHFSAHRADILIGTQMLAKGLDLPLVTLVGVVLAETALNLPDYRASERTFQVLTQVAGRAGRSALGGRVILQTFQPEAYPIQAASRQDYAGFYQQELGYRRELGYPPFNRLVRLEYRHEQEPEARRAAEELAARLREWIKPGERQSTDLIGPAPCFFTRQDGWYRWQIILRGPDPVSLIRGKVLAGWRIEVNPPSLL